MTRAVRVVSELHTIRVIIKQQEGGLLMVGTSGASAVPRPVPLERVGRSAGRQPCWRPERPVHPDEGSKRGRPPECVITIIEGS